jgi:ABC-type lipoprotein release transport system permease subunit
VRRLEELLEGVALHPLPAACAATTVLLAISSLAALRPARRAAAADPVEALRRE